MDSQAKIAAGECQVAIDQRLERLILSPEGADGEFNAAAAVAMTAGGTTTLLISARYPGRDCDVFRSVSGGCQIPGYILTCPNHLDFQFIPWRIL